MNGITIQLAIRAALIAASMLLGACATIVNSTRQDVSVASNPSGATVKVDNRTLGMTPLTASLSRRDSHLVLITMDGYKPFQMTLDRHLSGWVFGNLVIGGVIGIAVDAISGGMYRLSPQQVSVAMNGNQAALKPAGDGLYVLAVMQPQLGWEKIGQMQLE